MAFTVAVEDAEISAPLATVCQALADHFWRTSAELPIFGALLTAGYAAAAGAAVATSGKSINSNVQA